MSAGMEIVTGSFEQIILGLSVRQECDECELTESFTEKTIGSIKCVATSDKGLLAAGGTDEIIRIFDLKKHRLVGTLTHHSGTVTSLQFCDTHLFSTSEDGTLCLWRVATWEPERTFKGHKGPVKHVAVHPSGKMTLTVGQDRTLRLWNNMTGRSAYISNLKEPAELVSWSPGGCVLCGGLHDTTGRVQSGN
ncbi:p21-activated protein kinase-interacting protein 1-like [Babylonia areolata]|uniref:p21-activated protein kinase-interacting protein 1-like n=1 Tax=Babylonia areolata TaxID=304850 RepID=UPI003FD26375